MVVGEIEADYTINVGGYRYGFQDTRWHGFDTSWVNSSIELGPFGTRACPVKAATGAWMLLGALLVAIILLAILLTRRNRGQSHG